MLYVKVREVAFSVQDNGSLVILPTPPNVLTLVLPVITTDATDGGKIFGQRGILQSITVTTIPLIWLQITEGNKKGPLFDANGNHIL